MVVCLDRGADLHMAQLMPLLLTVSCFSKIQIGLPFWYLLARVVPEKWSLNGCVCVLHYQITHLHNPLPVTFLDSPLHDMIVNFRIDIFKFVAVKALMACSMNSLTNF